MCPACNKQSWQAVNGRPGRRQFDFAIAQDAALWGRVLRPTQTVSYQLNDRRVDGINRTLETPGLAAVAMT